MEAEPHIVIPSDPDLSPAVRVHARAANLFVARAAYREVVARYPEANITLRQGARVVEEYLPCAPGG